mmetsp:Transcript_11558/g.27558  ORF Transcript_11558/g.27558 Transcript_11558/m.27558 type:complete len:203 (+) Transcript_11558:776-1384(+)
MLRVVLLLAAVVEGPQPGRGRHALDLRRGRRRGELLHRRHRRGGGGRAREREGLVLGLVVVVVRGRTAVVDLRRRIGGIVMIIIVVVLPVPVHVSEVVAVVVGFGKILLRKVFIVLVFHLVEDVLRAGVARVIDDVVVGGGVEIAGLVAAIAARGRCRWCCCRRGFHHHRVVVVVGSLLRLLLVDHQRGVEELDRLGVLAVR